MSPPARFKNSTKVINMAPWLNLNDVCRKPFPGGERHVVLNLEKLKQDYATLWGQASSTVPITIDARIKSPTEIMDILMATDALRHNGFKRLNLFMPYCPYAQQDRYAGEGTSFSLRVFADLINSLNFENVYLYEPHSDVTPALIRNSHPIGFEERAAAFAVELSDKFKSSGDNKIMIVAPDGGGVKRTLKVFDYMHKYHDDILHDKIAFASKTRNLNTGALEFLSISDNIEDKHLLVVDDVCIGGGTFIQLAKGIIERNISIKSISLFTAHGIYSNGIEDLLSYYNYLGCTDSWMPDTFPSVKMYELSDTSAIKAYING